MWTCVLWVVQRVAIGVAGYRPNLRMGPVIVFLGCVCACTGCLSEESCCVSRKLLTLSSALKEGVGIVAQQ
jgi:hypothetical protein